MSDDLPPSSSTTSSASSTPRRWAPIDPESLPPLEPRARATVGQYWRDHRTAAIVMLVLSAILFVVVLALVERVLRTDEVLRGIEVGGLDLSGSTEAEAQHRLEDLDLAMQNRTVHGHAGDQDLVLEPAAIGFHIDAPATVRAARRAGRSRNPIDSLTGLLLRRVRPDEVPLVITYDPAKLAAVLDGWVGQTGKGLVDGGLRFEGANVAEISPKAGVGIDRRVAQERVLETLRRAAPDIGELRIGRTRPAIDQADVRRAATLARRILARPFRLQADGAVFTLTPAEIAGTLRTEIADSRLRITVDEAALRAALGTELALVERPPRDATFSIEGNRVSVVPGEEGLAVALGRPAAAIARALHQSTASLERTKPARTTEWAQALNITELVSSYSTNFPCCQPRVKNIQVGANAINDTIVEPGATFSLNDALGPRTTAKGYVLAPGIGANLEFEDSVGGGVSQLSTTLYNATFFGCYEDVTHSVHALYISRYPMGREATLNYPSIDNKFRNDSRSGVLIRAYSSGTSVTVALFGNKEGRSCRAEGPNILETIEIEVEYIDDPTLPIGTERERSPGTRGYVVENFRIISRPGQPDVRERYVERYSMAKAKVARGTGPPPSTTTTTVVPVSTSTTSPPAP